MLCALVTRWVDRLTACLLQMSDCVSHIHLDSFIQTLPQHREVPLRTEVLTESVSLLIMVHLHL